MRSASCSAVFKSVRVHCSSACSVELADTGCWGRDRALLRARSDVAVRRRPAQRRRRQGDDDGGDTFDDDS
eukprot:4211597-Pleurochrysis_carterae.AAC.3